MTILRFILPVCLLTALASCVDGPDVPPPAAPSTPQITAGLGFNSPLYDDLPNRHDPCVWFDGSGKGADQVTIFTYTVDAQGQTIPLYNPQIFRDGKDFYGGNPGGLHFKAPEKGAFWAVVRIYGKPNADCCPGPPPGRPVYQAIWPWLEIDKGFPALINIGHFSGECLYF